MNNDDYYEAAKAAHENFHHRKRNMGPQIVASMVVITGAVFVPVYLATHYKSHAEVQFETDMQSAIQNRSMNFTSKGVMYTLQKDGRCKFSAYVVSPENGEVSPRTRKTMSAPNCG